MKIETINAPGDVISRVYQGIGDKASIGGFPALRAIPETGEVEIIPSEGPVRQPQGFLEELADTVRMCDYDMSEDEDASPDVASDDHKRIEFLKKQLQSIPQEMRLDLLRGEKPQSIRGTDKLFLQQITASVQNREIRDGVYALLAAMGQLEEHVLAPDNIKAQMEAEGHASASLYCEYGPLGLIMWFDTVWYAVSPFRGGIWAMENGNTIAYREVEKPLTWGDRRVYPSASFLMWAVMSRIRRDVEDQGKSSEFPPVSTFVAPDGNLKETA